MAKTSKYPKEFRNKMARECYEQLQENKTTIIQFPKENNIDTKCLRGWIQRRCYKTEISSPSFVKIEKAPASAAIEYHGAKIQTNGDNLAYVLGAIKAAETI